jgi:hypothetical protein
MINKSRLKLYKESRPPTAQLKKKMKSHEKAIGRSKRECSKGKSNGHTSKKKEKEIESQQK